MILSDSAPDGSAPITVQPPEAAQSPDTAQSTEMADLLNRSAGPLLTRRRVHIPGTGAFLLPERTNMTAQGNV
ncbi:hypothetical protein COEREDRAFT_83349 [Coemansia reversa NRRL 1564]|uniref:Uncharacterized protein n=1 Tax=Coemansia reversa (strain ATCC 12441 / NRRL 1564) TaxID=763665 RepID=A0A2G5B3Q7_COERN|nr:hypothetical protein COEREDRAFT_83349 [Coemansia reversa NRRL 1564]|eukprot:PIA13652.1 hypothetical protein COEREDRAFT_83349 [Coemansia reversa NRRL 1564]